MKAPPFFIAALVVLICLCGTGAHSATFEVLRSFEAGPTSPSSSFVRGIDGNFYGSSGYGGKFDAGTIYRVTPTNDIAVVVSFTGRGGAAPGNQPGELIQDAAGNLYGGTAYGGAVGLLQYGTVFRVTPAGEHTLLHDFNDPDGSAPGGGHPLGPLARDAEGNLYGAAMIGGAATKGTLFKITGTGQFSVLVHFTGTGGNAPGAGPNGGLISDGAGGFLGTTNSGGTSNCGVVFRVLPDGTYTVLGEFTGASGALPRSGPIHTLTADGAGNFYGLTSGFLHPASVFRVNASGTVTSVAAIESNVGGLPSGSLVREESGNFLGVLGFGPTDPISSNQHGSIFRVTPAGVVTLVNDLRLSPAGPLVGDHPLALTPDGVGGHIGAMKSGGNNNAGSLFRLNPAGDFVHLTAMPGATPAQPRGTLVADAAGHLYGTTRLGGPAGEGTVFKLTPGGSYSTVAAFTGISGAMKGSIPYPELAIDSAGNLFGTTVLGGMANSGTVFKIAPGGAFTTLVEFTGAQVGGNGRAPQGVVIDGVGNLLGAAHGYSEDLDNDGAVVFKIMPTGTFSIVGSSGVAYSHFPAGRLGVDESGNVFGSTRTEDDDPPFLYRLAPDGAGTRISTPRDTSLSYGLARGPDGAFYGSAISAPLNVTRSVIAKVTATGSYGELAVLDAAANGSYPAGEVLVDETGNVFGTTSSGGPHGRGTIFRVSPRGLVTALHAFDDLIAPLYWARGVMRHPDGALYGSIERGGSGGGGVIYRLRSGPTPTTQEATEVSERNATLRAKVNPHGEASSVVFEYGPTPALGSETASVEIGSGTSFVSVDAPITGLTAGRTYFFRARAKSLSGTQFGDLLNTSAAYAPMDLWKINHLGNPNHSDLADPDGDGVPLLIEYGLNLSPTIPDLSGVGTPVTDIYRLALTFERDSTRTDINLIVEGANTPAGPWSTIATSFNGAPFPGESATPGVHTVTVRVPWPSFNFSSHFIRLRVTRG